MRITEPRTPCPCCGARIDQTGSIWHEAGCRYDTPLAVARADSRVSLSPQEARAIVLWASETKQRAAREMGISVDTVDQYLTRARAKYAAVGRAAHTKTGLVARAIEDGLVRVQDVQ